ncbi:unnamed protein product [Brassica rapa subsp. narinosa]
MRDQLCRDETRVIMYFLEMNGKFPTYYVEVLCNVFGDNEKKVKATLLGNGWIIQRSSLIA